MQLGHPDQMRTIPGAVRVVLRPTKIHFEEQKHETRKVGKIELPWRETSVAFLDPGRGDRGITKMLFYMGRLRTG